jgi:hypothetical protein
MTEAMNTKTMKGKVLIVAIVLATALAALAAMAATAKPAEAATICRSYAHAPTATTRDANGWKLIMFRSTIQCTDGKARGANIGSVGQYYDTDRRRWVDLEGTAVIGNYRHSSSLYSLVPRFNCSKANPGVTANVRTVHFLSSVKGADGKWRALPDRYSGYKTITCKKKNGTPA